jgi:hypothetical protein
VRASVLSKLIEKRLACVYGQHWREPQLRERDRLKPRATSEINGSSGCAAAETEFQKKFPLLGHLFGV